MGFEHMEDYPEDRIFLVAKWKTLPCGQGLLQGFWGADPRPPSCRFDQATQFYAEACLNAGVSLINCMPSLLQLIPGGQNGLNRKASLIVGDGMHQMQATIIHRC